VPSTPRRDRFPGPRRTALLGFRPLRHSPAPLPRRSEFVQAPLPDRANDRLMDASAGPVHPGFPHPGTFRPQGLSTLSTVCSLRRLAKPVGSAASLGFSLQGLAPPGPRCPSRGLASPAVPRPHPQAEPARLQRIVQTPAALPAGAMNPGRGPTRQHLWKTKTWPPNLALLGVRPSRAFSSVALRPRTRPKPFLPFDRKRSLRFRSRAGFQGFGVRRKRLVSLETAGPPGVLHLIATSTSADPRPPWLMVSPRPPGTSPAASSDGDAPYRSSVLSRLGA